MGTERGSSLELAGEREGIRLVFANPELLRAYILDSARQPGASFAERRSGIREKVLGEFPLDGELFKTIRFTLITEPDRDPRNKKPTAIVRADLSLGWVSSSNLQLFQTIKAQKQELGERLTELPTDISDKIIGIARIGWDENTIRIGKPSEDERDPFVLLQLWDPDVGEGVISISLLSYHRYATDYLDRYYANKAREQNGWEINPDDVNRWQFGQPVGIAVDEKEKFAGDLKFFEEHFPKVIKALYQSLGTKFDRSGQWVQIPVPNLALEIEPPLVLREGEKISFADIGGQSLAVDFFRALTQSIKAEKLGFAGLPMVLLAGPSGNGKSSLVKAFSGELEVPLVVKTSKDLPSRLEEADVLSLLESGYLEARAAARRTGRKSIYCLEGIETILDRSPRLHDFLLNSMDEWSNRDDVLFMATSNFPEQLHPGIVSRFQTINVLQPNNEGRKEILQIHAGRLTRLIGHSRVFGEVDFGKVAQRLDSFSGRDIVKFLSMAYQMNVLRNQQGGGLWLPIDTEFLLYLAPQEKKIGFRTS